MHLTYFQWYIFVVNATAFLIYTIDYQIYIHGGKGVKPEVILNLVTILGGAIGTLIAETVWDRKINKQNAQSRIYTVVWLIVQIAFFWALWGPNHEIVKEKVVVFFNGHKIICWYYAVINIVTFIVFAVDKIKAMVGAWRIREAILLGLSVIGGAVGGLLAMDICNHKVNKMHFMFGLPIMICAHLVLLVFIAAGAI